MAGILDFERCRPLKPPKSVRLPLQPSRPLRHPNRYPHICATCCYRYGEKRELTLHTKLRHNPTFKRSATFQSTWGVTQYCSICNFTGTNRTQLCEHSKNSHPLELIRLMFSRSGDERREFVYLSSASYTTTSDRIMLYRLESEMAEVLEELKIDSTTFDREKDLRPIIVCRKGAKNTLPEVVRKIQTGTGTIEEFETLF